MCRSEAARTTTLELLSATASDGMTAVMIILAMSFGLIIPKMLIDFVGDKWADKRKQHPTI